MSGVTAWIGTWLVMILLLVFLAQTRWGRPVVYGILWLAIVLLLVTHTEELTSWFDLGALELNG